MPDVRKYLEDLVCEKTKTSIAWPASVFQSDTHDAVEILDVLVDLASEHLIRK